MSALKIFCFASLICLSLADPIPPTATSTALNLQDQLNAITADIQNVIQTRLRNLLTNLSEDDQIYLETVTVKAMQEYLNYMIFANNTVSPVDTGVILTMASDGYNYLGSSGSTTSA